MANNGHSVRDGRTKVISPAAALEADSHYCGQQHSYQHACPDRPSSLCNHAEATAEPPQNSGLRLPSGETQDDGDSLLTSSPQPRQPSRSPSLGSTRLFPRSSFSVNQAISPQPGSLTASALAQLDSSSQYCSTLQRSIRSKQAYEMVALGLPTRRRDMTVYLERVGMQIDGYTR